MTEAEAKLVEKNLIRWDAFIKKVVRKAKAADRKLTEDEEENLQMRRAQCVVWNSQLKQVEKRGFSGKPARGSMSAGSKVQTSEQAVATK